MQCYHCQADIPGDAEFCIACGKRLARPATGPTRRINPPPATGSTRLLNPPPALPRSLNDLPRKLRKTVKTGLAPAERITWIDQPVRFLPPLSAFLILFNIFCTALITVALLVAAKRDGILTFVPFVLVVPLFMSLLVLSILSQPAWVWRKMRQTVYLITNKRAIIIECGWPTRVSSFTPFAHQVRRRENADGTGDVIITTREMRYSRRNIQWVKIGFMGIRNAQEAEWRLLVLQLELFENSSLECQRVLKHIASGWLPIGIFC